MERINPKELEEWLMQIDSPLPWETRQEVQMWSEEDEAATWSRAAATIGG